MMMKRKKWTEEEEMTLMTAYSDLASTGSISRLKTREKKFQPVADRVNAAHHLLNPAAFPFRWTWRDVSVKIQNMRNQYLGVKQKILLQSNPSSSSSSFPQFDWEIGDHHWPNFLRYKQIFGDIDLDSSSAKVSGEAEEEEDDEGEDAREEEDDCVGPTVGGRMMKRAWEMEEEEERERRRRRREERREEEEMEWMERMVGMQMEHEKQMLQMHADSCQAHLQVMGILARLMCQFLGPLGGGDGGLGGLTHQALQNLQNQQQQQDQGSIGADNGKSDTSSPGPYM